MTSPNYKSQTPNFKLASTTTWLALHLFIEGRPHPIWRVWAVQNGAKTSLGNSGVQTFPDFK